MDTAGKPRSADENIRRLRKLQQDANRAFREHVNRHRAEVISRQNQFRENFSTAGADIPPAAAPEETPTDMPAPEEVADRPPPDVRPAALKARRLALQRSRARRGRRNRNAPSSRPEHKRPVPETMASPSPSPPPPPAPEPEPEEILSAEEQKVLDEIEIFETLWQNKDAKEAPSATRSLSRPGRKRRSFFSGLFDLSPQFGDGRTDDDEAGN